MILKGPYWTGWPSYLMWLVWFGLLGWSGGYYVLELVRVADKVCLGWLWQSGISKWSDRTGKSKVHSVLDSLKAFFSFPSLKSQFVLSFQKIFWPQRPPRLLVDLGLFLCQKKLDLYNSWFSWNLCYTFEILWNFVSSFIFCEIFEIFTLFWKFVETW